MMKISQETAASKQPDLATALTGSPYELLLLIEQDCQMQRETGRAVKRTFRMQRRRLLRASLKKMAKASWLQIGQAALNSVCSIGQQVANTYGNQETQEWTKISGDFVKDLRPLDQLAKPVQRSAQNLQLKSQERGEAAADMQPWLEGARELERKMVSRLEDLVRLEQQERAQAIGG